MVTNGKPEMKIFINCLKPSIRLHIKCVNINIFITIGLMRTGWNGPVFLSCASSTQPACCLSFHIADNPRTDVEQISGRHMEFDCRSQKVSSPALRNFVDQLDVEEQA